MKCLVWQVKLFKQTIKISDSTIEVVGVGSQLTRPSKSVVELPETAARAVSPVTGPPAPTAEEMS